MDSPGPDGFTCEYFEFLRKDFATFWNKAITPSYIKTVNYKHTKIWQI